MLLLRPFERPNLNVNVVSVLLLSFAVVLLFDGIFFLYADVIVLPLPFPVVNFDVDPAVPDDKGVQKRAQVAVDIAVAILACGFPIVLAGVPVVPLSPVAFPAIEWIGNELSSYIWITKQIASVID